MKLFSTILAALLVAGAIGFGAFEYRERRQAAQIEEKQRQHQEQIEEEQRKIQEQIADDRREAELFELAVEAQKWADFYAEQKISADAYRSGMSSTIKSMRYREADVRVAVEIRAKFKAMADKWQAVLDAS